MSWRSQRKIDHPGVGTVGQTAPIKNQLSTSHRSFNSTAPATFEMYASPETSDDMHDILSPSFDSFNDGVNSNNNNNNNGSCNGEHSIGSSYSADSIIRRVEEEIAAARKAASNVKLRGSDACLVASESTDPSVGSERKMRAALSPGSSFSHLAIVKSSSARASRDPSPASLRSTKHPSPGSSHFDTYLFSHAIEATTHESLTRQDRLTRELTSKQSLSRDATETSTNSRLSINDRLKSDRQITLLSSRSEERNSDDDMHDILGVNDNDDEEEKKSSDEPSTRARSNCANPQTESEVISCHPSNAVRSKGCDEKFDKIDYLRRKVNGDQMISPEADKYADASGRRIRNKPSDFATGSAAGNEPIYFTDEDWQIDDEAPSVASNSPRDIGNRQSDRMSCRNIESPSSCRSSDNFEASQIDMNLAGSKRADEHISSPHCDTVDTFQIIEKSSTEDAIVSAQHHPVFQKRVSAADSNVGDIVQNSSRVSKRLDQTGEVLERESMITEPRSPGVKAMIEAIDSSKDVMTPNGTSPKHLSTKKTPSASIQSSESEVPLSVKKESSNVSPFEQAARNSKTHLSLYEEIAALNGSLLVPAPSEPSIGMLAGKLSELTSSLVEPEETNSVINEIDNGDPDGLFVSDVCNGTNEGYKELVGTTVHSSDTTFAHDNKSKNFPVESSLVSSCHPVRSPKVATLDSATEQSNKVYQPTDKIDTSSEWDKASELLVRLKEQRVSFSSTFSPVHPRSNDPSPSSKWTEPISTTNRNRENSLPAHAETLLDSRQESDTNDSTMDFDGNLDEQSSVASSSPGVRSPRYFNFMRVKRAKQRARKVSSAPNSSLSQSGLNAELSNVIDDETRSVEPNPVCNDNDELIEKKEQTKSALILSPKESIIDKSDRDNSKESNDPPEGADYNEGLQGNVYVSEAEAIGTHKSDPPSALTESINPGTPTHLSNGPLYPECASGSAPSPKTNRHIDKVVAKGLQSPNQTSTVDFRSATNRSESRRRDPEEDSSKHSKRIRFRNPFPVVKPLSLRRDSNEIIADHIVPIPEIPVRWVKPKKELRQLIVAAMGTSLARRSNACGALKVLTRHKKNQMTLVRTDGFLTALTFAVTQTISSEDRDLAVDARTRAVAALRNVCIPKDNRVLLLKHPGVVESLVHVIEMETGEGRALAAGAIALLAKTPCCRDSLAQAEGLLDILGRVLSSGTGDVEFDSKQNREIVEPSDDAEDFEVPQSSSKASNTLARGHDASIKMVDSIKNQAEEKRHEYISESRASACAALLHLSKHCSVSNKLCTNVVLLDSLVKVANEVTSSLHSKCLEIICNLSRFPANNGMLSRYDRVIETLVAASNSTLSENRLSALRTLQNMSSDPGSKSLLATSQVLTRMISCAMRKDLSEKEVAVATIYNISTEPSAVASITNTKNVVATLVHLAHSPDSSSEVRLLACESLSTISLWLQTLAGTGKVPEGVSNVPLPSQKTSGWQRWD